MKKSPSRLIFHTQLVHFIIVIGLRLISIFIHADGNPPYDGSPERVVETTPLALTIVYYTLATVGLVFTTMCLSFNIIFRNKPYVYPNNCSKARFKQHVFFGKTSVVKLASPNLNCLITVGAAMLYISIYFYSYSATVEYQATILCNVRN